MSLYQVLGLGYQYGQLGKTNQEQEQEQEQEQDYVS